MNVSDKHRLWTNNQIGFCCDVPLGLPFYNMALPSAIEIWTTFTSSDAMSFPVGSEREIQSNCLGVWESAEPCLWRSPPPSFHHLHAVISPFRCSYSPLVACVATEWGLYRFHRRQIDNCRSPDKLACLKLYSPHPRSRKLQWLYVVVLRSWCQYWGLGGLFAHWGGYLPRQAPPKAPRMPIETMNIKTYLLISLPLACSE